MKYVLNVILFIVLGLALYAEGIHCTSWVYWAVMACAVGISVNASLW